MRLALLSDIHANFQAFQAVWKSIQTEPWDAVICLGDIVGYGADPQACLDLWRHIETQRKTIVIAGNHEAAVCGRTDISRFSSAARSAVLWTREHISREALESLEEWPLIRIEDDMTLVHASPFHPEDWAYLFTPQEGRAAFQALTTSLAFLGHTHIPVIFEEGGRGVGYEAEREIFLSKEDRYLINVGSVGQPRDRDARACWLEFETDSFRLRYHRVTYDIARAQAKIFDSGLPRFCGERLALGV